MRLVDNNRKTRKAYEESSYKYVFRRVQHLRSGCEGELSGNSKWGGTLVGEAYEDGSVCDCAHYSCYDVKRTDPILVAVVEQLGEQANGACASLEVVEVQGKYHITEYDGAESVETPESIKWEE